jgi:hypothetical protein
VLTAAWSNGWGSCGSSSDGYSTGSRLRTRRTPGRPVSSVIVFCRVISAPPPDLNLVLHVPAPSRHLPGTGIWRLQSCRVAASCPAPGPCRCRKLGRLMPPGHIRGSDRRAGPGAEPVRWRRERVDSDARHAAPVPVPGRLRPQPSVCPPSGLPGAARRGAAPPRPVEGQNCRCPVRCSESSHVHPGSAVVQGHWQSGHTCTTNLLYHWPRRE